MGTDDVDILKVAIGLFLQILVYGTCVLSLCLPDAVFNISSVLGTGGQEEYTFFSALT